MVRDMKISDSERSEVAENLRYAADYPGYEIRYMEQFIAELRETVFCDVCSNAGYSDILQRIADLIDPTCHLVEDENGYTACSECGCTALCMLDASYCPECGARVVSGDE